MHVEKFCDRNLGGLTCARCISGTVGEGKCRMTNMNANEKSDKIVVPVKQPNKGGKTSAEVVEGRVLAKGNSQQTAADWTQGQRTASFGLSAVRKVAKEEKGTQFTALLHHITPDLLGESYFALKRNAAAGIDGMTWKAYGVQLNKRLQVLHARIHSGKYRANPARRTYIPKADGSQRPLSIWCIEDKIVQQAVVQVLNAIYEEDFIGFSYGFRPGRGQHDALDALQVGLYRKKISWVLDADIQKFFDEVDHEWMMKFLQHRIADKRILRLIRKWLTVGITENGKTHRTSKGTPQGAVISPVLANIYLHYAFDLWANKWRNSQAQGDMIIIRYADDSIIGFQRESDARLFVEQFSERMHKFGLTLHPDKTRLIRFGRYAAKERRARGEKKPETFDFLGFTHYCTKTRKGWFKVGRKSIKKRIQGQIQTIKEELRRRLHKPIQETGEWLKRVLQGHLNYYAVSGNGPSLNYFFERIKWYWLRSLRRRSQRHRMPWERFKVLLKRFFPPVRILHPQPLHRFDARTQGRSPVR